MNDKFRKIIAVGDTHFRGDTPLCRPPEENFIQIQIDKLIWLKSLVKQKNAMLVHSGDLFNTPRPSYKIVSNIINHLPFIDYIIAGNHDIPFNNTSLITESAYGIISLIKRFKCWNTTNYLNFKYANKNFRLEHRFVYKSKCPIWGKGSNKVISAKSLLREHPQTDIIITGDNHKGFKYTNGERWVINPGAFIRQTVKERDYQPRVYVYDPIDNTVETVNVPIKHDLLNPRIGLSYKETKERFESFISKLENSEIDTSISFIESIKNDIKGSTEMSEQVKKLLNKIIHEVMR